MPGRAFPHFCQRFDVILYSIIVDLLDLTQLILIQIYCIFLILLILFYFLFSFLALTLKEIGHLYCHYGLQILIDLSGFSCLSSPTRRLKNVVDMSSGRVPFFPPFMPFFDSSSNTLCLSSILLAAFRTRVCLSILKIAFLRNCKKIFRIRFYFIFLFNFVFYPFYMDYPKKNFKTDNSILYHL